MTFTITVYDMGTNVLKRVSFVERVEYEGDRVLCWKKVAVQTDVPDIVICNRTGVVIVEKD